MTVTLTLATAVVAGDTVTVGYTKPTSGTDNVLEDADGNEVDDFTVGARNNTPQVLNFGILGPAQVGMTLTADTDAIDDPDGTTGSTFTYQWIRGSSDITGETERHLHADLGGRPRREAAGARGLRRRRQQPRVGDQRPDQPGGAGGGAELRRAEHDLVHGADRGAQIRRGWGCHTGGLLGPGRLREPRERDLYPRRRRVHGHEIPRRRDLRPELRHDADPAPGERPCRARAARGGRTRVPNRDG